MMGGDEVHPPPYSPQAHPLVRCSGQEQHSIPGTLAPTALCAMGPIDHRTGYYPDSYKPRRANGRLHDSDSASDSSFSSSSSSTSYDSDDSELQELQAAEREWEENMRQLQLAVSVLIMPTLGKYLGRRWSYFCESVILCAFQSPSDNCPHSIRTVHQSRMEVDSLYPGSLVEEGYILETHP